MLVTWHFHIEISSKCTLKCPRCPRQEVPETLVNTQLRLDFFKKHFPRDFVLEHIEKITFCGDDGDPIYAADLIPVIQYFKNIKDIEFLIVTNGSYKPESWWKELASTLTSKDSIHFSIDGYNDASNNLYRVNSNWDSIMTGLRTMTQSNAVVVWAAIAFKFNENHIEQMKQIAQDAGVDIFQLTKSTKFGSVYEHYGKDDPLEPSSKYVSSTLRFEREETQFGKRIVDKDVTDLYNSALHNNTRALCSVGAKGLFITSLGEFYPCCWVGNRYAHNSEWEGKFSLYRRSLQDVLADEFWDNEFKTYRWQECQTKCAANAVTLESASKW
jgi:MoaA/NifB/PqqE/SkfB family radical SAM enzyme